MNLRLCAPAAALLSAVCLLSAVPAQPALSAVPAASRPVVGIHGPSEVKVGARSAYQVVFKVKSSARSVRVRVDWGDGSPAEVESFKLLCVAARCATSPTKLGFAHTFAAAGSFVASFTVLDAGRVLAPHYLTTTIQAG